MKLQLYMKLQVFYMEVALRHVCHKNSIAVFFYILVLIFISSKVYGGDISQINSYETWNADPQIIPSTDPAGISWDANSGNFFIVDSEINEEEHWAPNYKNVFITNTTGSVLLGSTKTRPFASDGSSREPTGICYNPNDGYYYVTNDDRNKLYRYEFVAGEFSFVKKWFLGSDPNGDPEDIADFQPGLAGGYMTDPEGITVNPSNEHFYIADGASGARKIVAVEFDFQDELSYIASESFSVAAEQNDAEGIAYRPSTGTLFIMSSGGGAGSVIYEWNFSSGTLIDTYVMNSFTPTPISPQGLTFGPRSTNGAFESLYIADAGEDNTSSGNPQYNDGVIYEAKIGNEDTPLPVELISFTASAFKNGIILQWATASELNNVGFEIFRAENEDDDFIELSSYKNNDDLIGQGNSSTSHKYTYVDEMVESGKTYWYKLADLDYSGIKTFHEARSVTITPETPWPVAIKLYPNYPNPFNPSTTIKFEVNELLSTTTPMKLVIYNSIGQAIKEMEQTILTPGIYQVQWDGKNAQGNDVPGGAYFAHLNVGRYSKTIRMSLVK